jgi:hypothetical protein
VTPHPAGLALTLQRRQGSGWLAAGATRANAGGAFTFSVKPAAVGLATYRVVTSKSAGYLGASASVAVDVLEWRYLADIYDAPSVGDLYTEPVTLNGVRYDHPVRLDAGCYNHWGGDGWVNYKLGRRAKAFTASVTFGGLANAGSNGSYTIYADGKIVSSGDLHYGTVVKLNLPVAGVKSLRLLGNVPNTAGDGSCSLAFTEIVFGDAEILTS